MIFNFLFLPEGCLCLPGSVGVEWVLGELSTLPALPKCFIRVLQVQAGRRRGEANHKIQRNLTLNSGCEKTQEEVPVSGRGNSERQGFLHHTMHYLSTCLLPFCWTLPVLDGSPSLCYHLARTGDEKSTHSSISWPWLWVLSGSSVFVSIALCLLRDFPPFAFPAWKDGAALLVFSARS